MTNEERAVIEAAKATVLSGQACRIAVARTVNMDGEVCSRKYHEQYARRCETLAAMCRAELDLINAVDRLWEQECPEE